jgi:hypothetical protein
MDETGNQPELAAMLGGSDAPANEASTQSGAREESQSTQAAAWTSQLSKELRGNSEAFSKVANFKTVSELAEAYLKNGSLDMKDAAGVLRKLGAPEEGKPYDFEKSLEEGLQSYGAFARKAMLTPDQAKAMLDGYRSLEKERITAYTRDAAEKAPEISKALVEEFGAEASAYYHKAVSKNKLNSLIVQSGLGANKDIARALVLLGREMSEDYTPSSGRSRKPEPETIKNGAMFSYS